MTTEWFYNTYKAQVCKMPSNPLMIGWASQFLAFHMPGFSSESKSSLSTCLMPNTVHVARFNACVKWRGQRKATRAKCNLDVHNVCKSEEGGTTVFTAWQNPSWEVASVSIGY